MDKKTNKIIHYIWFGGNPITDLTKKCIQTWKKYLPDFEIKEWNESNFDVNQCTFVKQAYEQKKWAFVADYTRFKVLEEYGGIYLDTDMEITADISKYLELDLFMGQEDSKMINAAVVWAKEAHNTHIQKIVKLYEECEKFNATGDLYDQSVPRILTKYFEELGFNKDLDEIQSFDDGKTKIYPMEYFYPLSYDYQNNKFTDNSCMIHHFDATWISPMEKFKTKMKRKNMIWVVYIIDFFVTLKNKIKFFSNPRDLATFVTMFFVLICSLLALKPVEVTTSLSNIFNKEFGTSVIQIVLMSCIWTFICSKIRNIDFNSYGDKILGRKQEDIDNGIIENKAVSTEQKLKLNKRENQIFAVQYIVTLLVSLFPIFQIATIVPNNAVLYSLLFLVNMYMLYVGMTKKFRYRILELIPFGAILGLLIISNFSVGLILSLVSFIFVLIELKINKQKKKRLISFIVSFAICFLLALIYLLVSKNGFGNMRFSLDITSESVVENAVNYTNPENVVTDFNYMSNYVGGSIKNISNNIPILASTITYFICSILLAGTLSLITKNKNYLFFIVILVCGTIQVVATELNFGYMSVIATAVLLLMVAQKGIVKLLDKE